MIGIFLRKRLRMNKAESYYLNAVKPRNLVIVFALLQLCVALLTDSNTFTHEESMWHYIGRNWFRFGLTPYDGGIDNKSPLIFAVFGLSDVLFGINFWFPRVMGVVIEAAGLYFLYKIAIRLTANRQMATLAVTIYGLSLLWRTTGGKYVSFTETYANALIIIFIYNYISAETNKKLFISGLLAGFGVCWRLSALFSVIAVAGHALFNKRNALVPFFAGFLTSILVLLFVAISAGIHPGDLWFYMVRENMGGGSTTDHSLRWKVESFMNAFVFSEMPLFYPVLVMWFFIKKRYSVLTIWLVCEFIGIVMLGIYARPHMKALLPALSLIGGISIVELAERYRLSYKHILIAVWIIFFPKVTEPLIAIKRMTIGSKIKAIQDNCIAPYPRPNEQKEKALGLWIKSNTNAGNKVLVAGFGARVQLYSGRLSPSVYFNVTQTPMAIQRFKREVLADKPALIAVPVFSDYARYVNADLRGFIDSLIKTEYSYVECLNGYEIYKTN
jgi:hypothetical protein